MGCGCGKKTSGAATRIAVAPAPGAADGPALHPVVPRAASRPPAAAAAAASSAAKAPRPSQGLDEPPTAYEVSGAGEERANGVYKREGLFHGVPQYTNLNGCHLMRYRFRSGNAYWFITIPDKSGEPRLDRDLYRTPMSEEALPPTSGWMAAASENPQPKVVGAPPAPNVQPRVVRVDLPARGPYPASWASAAAGGEFRKMTQPSRATFKAIDDMMQRTFLGRYTRDRGGAEVPKRLELRNLLRFECAETWDQYAHNRRRIAAERRKCEQLEEIVACKGELPGRPADDPAGLAAACPQHARAPPVPWPCRPARGRGGARPAPRPPQRRPVLTRGFELAGELDPSCNEFFLWHGTKPSAAMGILEKGFRIPREGAVTHGSMFGRGAYFAEASSKADEYAEDEVGGLYTGLFAMLLCRVCCGKMHYTTEADSGAVAELLKARAIDSVLGDREAAVGTYREFVVFEPYQVYPEFVFVYARSFED